MSTSIPTRRIALVATLLLAGLPALRAQPANADEIQALRAQIAELDQKLRVLERKEEIKEEAAAAAAASAARITINDKGYTFGSADSSNSLRVRGLVQLDSRVFFNDRGATNNTFLLRRARLIAEGVFAKNYSFQLVPEFGGGSATGASAVSIVDANIGVTVNPALTLKLGKFKSPLGLELLQSDSWTFFNERSLATNLVPNRDLGVQASGDLLGGRANYTVALLGGVADGGSTANADFDNDKDAVGRLYLTPFKNAGGSALQGLGFGVGGSYGRQKTASGRTAGYRTDGQQAFFTYATATIADGPVWRVTPQFDYRYGSFGALGEYVVSAVNVRAGTGGLKAELRNQAWQFAVGTVLTGEYSSPSGVVPANNFDAAAGTWGAFEVVARVSNLNVDDDAFPTFASPTTSANEARSLGLGLNWYLSKSVRASFDYYQTRFGFNAAAPAVSTVPFLRQDEKALITRLQISF